MVPLKFKMRLAKVKRETPDTVTLTLEGERPGFKPGQFFMLEFTRQEKIPKRSYSVSSSPERKGILEFTVKEMPEGYVSRLLCAARAGEEFMVDGPWGHFIFDDALMPQIVMIGAGSGIAPFRCFGQYIMDRNLSTKATLVYSSKTAMDIICAEDLEEFAGKLPNFRLLLTLSREQREGMRFGRVDQQMVNGLVHENGNGNAHYFVCGPPQMVADVQQMLAVAGIPKERVKTEKYG